MVLTEPELAWNGSLHQSSVLDIDVDPDGKFIASASYDKTARLWDMGGEPLWESYLGGAVTSVRFSPCSELLACGTLNGYVHVLDAKTAEKLRIFASHKNSIHIAVFGRYSTDIYSTCGGDIKIWRDFRSPDTEPTEKCLFTFDGLRVSPDPNFGLRRSDSLTRS